MIRSVTLLKNNPNVVSGTPDNPIEITSATLVTQARANALIDGLYAYYVYNSEVTQKIIVTDETPGDRVQTVDILNNDFFGDHNQARDGNHKSICIDADD